MPKVKPPRPERRFLRLKEVVHVIGFSRSSIYSLIEKGEFPQPVKIGLRAVAWDSDQVYDWRDEKFEQANPL